MTDNDNNEADNTAKEIRKQLRRDRISSRLNDNANSSNNESDKPMLLRLNSQTAMNKSLLPFSDSTISKPRVHS